MTDPEFEKLKESISSGCELQIYLHVLVYIQFIIIGFCIGFIFMANQTGPVYNPGQVEHKVREITAICIFLYVSVVLTMFGVDSKLRK